MRCVLIVPLQAQLYLAQQGGPGEFEGTGLGAPKRGMHPSIRHKLERDRLFFSHQEEGSRHESEEGDYFPDGMGEMVLFIPLLFLIMQVSWHCDSSATSLILQVSFYFVFLTTLLTALVKWCHFPDNKGMLVLSDSLTTSLMVQVRWCFDSLTLMIQVSWCSVSLTTLLTAHVTRFFDLLTTSLMVQVRWCFDSLTTSLIIQVSLCIMSLTSSLTAQVTRFFDLLTLSMVSQIRICFDSLAASLIKQVSWCIMSLSSSLTAQVIRFFDSLTTSLMAQVRWCFNSLIMFWRHQ